MERFEDAESRLVEALKDEGIPTIIALTKHGMFPDFRADVLQLAPAADAVIPIRALEMPNLAGTFGLTDLVEATFRLLPDAVKSSFVAAKKVDGAMKAADSRKVISGAVTAAVTTALIPLPFSDAITIVPIQIGMVTGTYTPLESRQAILHGLSATDCAIIEYDYCPELSFRANSLASHFKLNQTAEQTFHIRILGKIYLPGARLWFMTAPQAYFGRSLDLKRTADMHRPNIIQDAAEFFLREHSVRSRLPDDVVRMRGRAQRLFAAPVEQPLKGCLTQLPRGLSFWVALPHVVTDRALYHAAVAQSVAFASGSIFEANAQNEPHGVGIGFGTLPAEALGKAARRLTAALEPRTAPNIICSGGFRPIAVIQPYWCGRHAARNLGALPAHLPRYEVMIDVVHDACPCRGGAMHSIGEVLTEQLDMVPMQLRVRVTRRPCGACP
jgi:hypothetical protein